MINYDNLAPKHTESKKTMDGTITVFKLSLTEALNMLNATEIKFQVQYKLNSTAFVAEC